MITRFTKITFLFFIFCWLSHSGYGQSWQVVGSPGFSAGTAGFTNLALDAAGSTYVVYRDVANGYKATVNKYNGSSWETIGIAGFSSGGAWEPRLAIDAGGVPYVFYGEDNNGKKAAVRKFTGSSWVNVGAAGFSAGEVAFTSIALDASGTPYVVYTDYANGLKATVQKYNGSSWVTVGTGGLSAGQAVFISLALDANGMPYVAYTDYANGEKATVRKFNGSSWEDVGPAGFSAGRTFDVDLALDAAGTPWVHYRDVPNGEKSTVMKFDGSNWVTVGTAGLSTGATYYGNLEVDAAGTPFVAYADRANGQKATVRKFNGSSWVDVGPAGLSTGSVMDINIALDAAGVPIVVYRDGALDSKATVMRYAAPAPTVTTGNLGSSAYCAGTPLNVPFTTTASFAAGNTFTAQLSDAAGSFANPTPIGSGTASPIAATLPAEVAAGSAYRIRIVSAAPAVAGSDNGSNLLISSSPAAQPGPVTGATTINAGATGITYSVALVSQASAYNWTVPADWQITSGQGTTAITVAAGATGGQIAVTAVNACGASMARTLAVAVSQPELAITTQPAASNITGGQNTSFTASATGEGLTYQWQVSQDGGISFGNISNGGVYRGATTATLTLTKAPISMYGYRYRVQVSNGKVVTSNAVSLTVNVPAFDNSRVWQVEGGSGNYYYSPGVLSLALDPNGAPYVALSDDLNSGKVTVARFNGTNWVTVGAAAFSAGRAYLISLVVDANGTPFVAYQDEAQGNKATVMKFTGTSWVTVGPAGFSAGRVSDPSLAFDASGVLFIAYSDGANNNKSTVKKFAGGRWVDVGAAGFSAGEAWQHSLALDAEGNPFVVYNDGTNNYTATVSKFTGSNWVKVGTAGFVAGEFGAFTLKLDANNTPYVAYEDGTNGGKATVKRFTGSNWVDVGTAGFSAGRARYSSLALDAGGTPYVAYMDMANGDKAMVQKYNGNEWIAVGMAGLSAGEASPTRLALDAGGTPFLAYRDTGNGNKATVMKFASPQPVIKTSALAASAYCAGASLLVSYTATGTYNAGNTFTAQLSDAAGSFANPTPIGSGTASPISAALPADVAAGSGYRIRIVSAAPFVAGSNNGASFTIRSAALQPGNITGAATICPGQTASYAVAGVAAATAYTWQVPADWQITSGQGTTSITVTTGSSAGQMTVTAGNDCGQSTASTLAVALKPAVSGNSVASDQAICPGAVPQVLLGATPTGGNGAMTYLWESSSSGAFAPAPGINHEKDYTPPAGLLQTTWFRRRATADTCAATATYSNVIKITVLAIPKTPLAQNASQCGIGPVTLWAIDPENVAAESTTSFRWYTSAAGGQAIAGATSGTFITPVLTSSATYYVSVVNAAGCESERKAVSVAIHTVPEVLAGDNLTVCQGAAALSLTGFSPVGGSWSGPGVTAAGVFSPATAGPGTHTLNYHITYGPGCPTYASRQITVTTCTGIAEEAGMSEWSLYPNPTPDKIRVELSVKVKTNMVFRILRPDGSVVLEKAFPHVVGGFKQVFDLKGQAKGLYLLQQITDQGMVTKQFVLH